jgi:hypothetical protein
MEIQTLPRYRGLADWTKGWGEADGHGKKPNLRLRDYVVLALILGVCLPINLPRLFHYWFLQRREAEVRSVPKNLLTDGEFEREFRRQLLRQRDW